MVGFSRERHSGCEIENSGPYCLLSQGFKTGSQRNPTKKAKALCSLKLTKQLAHCLTSPIEMVYLLCKANSPGRNTRCSFSYLHSPRQSVFIATNMYMSLFVARVPCTFVASHPECISQLLLSTSCSGDPPWNSLVIDFDAEATNAANAAERERKSCSPTICSHKYTPKLWRRKRGIYGKWQRACIYKCYFDVKLYHPLTFRYPGQIQISAVILVAQNGRFHNFGWKKTEVRGNRV